MKLKYLRMINCQSFVDVKFELSEGLNVLYAPNETGKSIYMKMLDCFCWGGNFISDIRVSMIRDGEEKAEMHLMTEDDVLIKFIMHPSYSEYYMGETYYRENYIPEDIRLKLGWIIDTEEEILLNQMDVAKPSPLINTSSSYNGKLLGPHLNPVILNTTINNLEEKVIHLKPIKNRLTRRTNVIAANLGKRKNLDYIKFKIELATEYDLLLEHLKNFKQSVQEPELVSVPEYIEELVTLFEIEEPDEIIVPIYEVKELMNLINLKAPNKVEIPSYNVGNSLLDLVKLEIGLEPKTIDYTVEIVNLMNIEEPVIVTIPVYNVENLVKLIELKEPIISPEVLRIEKEIKICPTCNQNLEW